MKLKIIIYILTSILSSSVFFGQSDLVEIQKLIVSDISELHLFGFEVGVSGDYAVLGSVGYDNLQGAAYVYKRNGETWEEIKQLTASDGAAENQFGLAVAIDGDYIVVGSYDNMTNYYGGAYVFHKDEGGADNWGEVTKLTSPEGGYDEFFSETVAIYGDFIAVAAKNQNQSTGAIYMYHNNAGVWDYHSKLVASDGDSYDNFGFSVEIYGNYLITGAWLDEELAFDAGSAYIYKYENDVWLEHKKLLAFDGAESDYYGWDVSIYEDLIAVSATWDDDGGDYTGSVYLYQKDQGGADNWGFIKKLTAFDTNNDGDQFGFSVSINDTYALCTTHADDDHGNNSGAAYLFGRNTGGDDNWGSISKLIASDAGEEKYFGHACDLDGNYAFIAPRHHDADWVNLTDQAATYVFAPENLSIEESKLINAVVFPNPANDVVTVKGVDLNEVKIFDIQGKILFEQDSINEQIEIDILNFESGTYLVKVVSNNGSLVEKLIIY
ncbi:MAG: T9SS type A sorting domain-containing protein [Bacteroidota bacterium]